MRITKRSTMIAIITLLSLIAISGCESKWQKMSNSDLAQKRSDCIIRNPTAPGSVTACENVRKECDRRRKDGNYACGR